MSAPGAVETSGGATPKSAAPERSAAQQLADFLKAKPVRKYRNKPIEVGGVTFASRKEARRFAELQLMQRAGQIRFLRLQPKFPLIVGETKVAEYWADFAYVRASDDVQIIEDVKSPITRRDPVYRLKFKIMAAMGLNISEV